MSSKARAGDAYHAIDLTRFIMAVFVVLIHTDPLYNCTNPAIEAIYSCLLHSAVPFFFLCTGFFLVEIADTTARYLQVVTLR